MCLILLAVNPNDRFRLIVAANRDELYERPTKVAEFWDDLPDILAGRDESAGGTWLGVNRKGRFAAVTNFREDPPDPIPPASRGDLPTHFLTGELSPHNYCEQVVPRDDQYRGFNLLTADKNEVCYHSNRVNIEPRILDQGFYGLSNQLLDCDWPKVISGREKLKSIVNAEDLVKSLFELLLDEGDDREFSNSFISSDVYGTRAVTVLTINHAGEVYFEERNFGPGGRPLTRNQFRFTGNDDS